MPSDTHIKFVEDRHIGESLDPPTHRRDSFLDSFYAASTRLAPDLGVAPPGPLQNKPNNLLYYPNCTIICRELLLSL